ncbi:DUF2436 domain-containing protein [Porphyromonas gulae]|uniref:DUF2436 domain-containing protein n=1 Tax=Porphyromonas gulae TaxID=111105 RepID=UPI0009B851E9|nr:DUF2436 domain-containing protein [Porphyromonas gulae]
MKKQNSLFAFALLFSLWGLGQTAMAQKMRKEVSPARAKTLMLKQQKAEPSDLSKFRDEPIPGGMARIILEAHDVWGDGSGYQMLIDADHTAYGNEIPPPTPLGQCLTEDCNIPATLYDPFEFKVPAAADPSCTPEYQVVDGVASIDLPAGIYDYVVVNPSPGLCIVIPGIFGQADDTYGDDFRFEAGKIYHFLVAFQNGTSFSTTGDYVTLTVTDGTPFHPVQNLTATQDGMDAVLQWAAPAGKDETVLLKEGFESVEYEGIPAGWIAVDADGDGKNWGVLLPTEPATAWVNPHNGEAVIGSFSWLGTAFTPDNYLISPKVEGATKVKYYFAVNANYPAEHYAVMASSTGANPSDFTLVFEETSTGSKIADTKRDEYSGQTEWIERTVDLPAGTKYVAFRHYDCTNQNFIVFDDIEISGSSPGPAYTYSIYRNNVQIASGVTQTTYRDVNLLPGTYTYGVKVVYPDGESPVEEATLTITSLSETVTTRPYALTVDGHRIAVTCRGEVRIYDMNGRSVVTGSDVVEYMAQTGVYVIRISVDGRTYVEKVAVK